MTFGKLAGSGDRPAALNRSMRCSRTSQGVLDVPVVSPGL